MNRKINSIAVSSGAWRVPSFLPKSSKLALNQNHIASLAYDKALSKPTPRQIHRSYTVEEVAKLFSIHRNTVRNWIKHGLSTNDNRRPILILGRDLSAYLQARRTKNKRACKPGEFYCFRCRIPKAPAGNIAEYQSITETLGNLIAICPDCHSIMNQRIKLSKLALIRGRIDLTMPQA